MTTNEHLSEDALELFALGRLPDAELFGFDQHLSHCTACQERLAAAENYVATMQIALSRVEHQPATAPQHSWLSWARPAFAVAAAALVVLLALPLLREARPAQVIQLAAVRSDDVKSFAAGGPLELHLAAPAGSPEQVNVQIVDIAGNQQWSGNATQIRGNWIVKVDSLSSGKYWVRVSAGGSNPLHEYALLLK